MAFTIRKERMRTGQSSICVALAAAIIVGGSLFALQAAGAQAQQRRAGGPPIIRKSTGALMASATNRAEPEYPPLAKAAHVTGAVAVEITTDESGAVISAKAISGHPLF
jgi:outer membrane biosynthesis protein TonB